MRAAPGARLRRLAAHPRLMPLTARLICAGLVRESGRFFLREIGHPAGAYPYTLRASGAKVRLRHTVPDGATLAEVFHSHDYLPPEALAAALADPRRILDLGANIGLFGIYAATRWPQASIVGYEADPANAAIHEQTIAANGLAGRWRLERMAAGAHDGEIEFAAGMAMESFVVGAGGDPGVPTIKVAMRDVMAEVAGADLMKLDIEGGEWEILGDDRFRHEPPAVIVLEYHPHLCPGADPRAEAERLLAAAGMAVVPIWHRAEGYGMLWGRRA